MGKDTTFGEACAEIINSIIFVFKGWLSGNSKQNAGKIILFVSLITSLCIIVVLINIGIYSGIIWNIILFATIVVWFMWLIIFFLW